MMIACDEDEPCEESPHAATSRRKVATRTERRRTGASLSGRGRPQPAACIAELTFELARRRVSVVHVKGLAIRAHDHRGRQRVDVEAFGEVTPREGGPLFDGHPAP